MHDISLAITHQPADQAPPPLGRASFANPSGPVPSTKQGGGPLALPPPLSKTKMLITKFCFSFLRLDTGKTEVSGNGLRQSQPILDPRVGPGHCVGWRAHAVLVTKIG